MWQRSDSKHKRQVLTALAQRAASALYAAMNQQSDIMMASVDGLVLAHAGSVVKNLPRWAAMTGSLAALGDLVSKDLGISTVRCLVVESAQGRLFVRHWRIGEESLVVAVRADPTMFPPKVWNHLNAAEKMLNRQLVSAQAQLQPQPVQLPAAAEAS